MGRVLSAVDRLGAADRTVVLFAADHGFSLGDQGGWGKRTLWETDSRVPLIVRIPTHLRPAGKGAGAGAGGAGAGRRSLALVEMVDVLPTLAELAGLDHQIDPLLALSSRRTRRGRRQGGMADGGGVVLPGGEPPLDGTSFAGLVTGRGGGGGGGGGSRRATTQFPRCPVRWSRRGERKCLLTEPWRSAGAGGFECQGRSSDWAVNHELAVMGYSHRTLDWRYTAWVRVVGYRRPEGAAAGGGAKDKAEPWAHNRLVVNWTWPPYFEELYDHREVSATGISRPGVSTEEAQKLRASGGGFDLDEVENVAMKHPNVGPVLFRELRELFDLSDAPF